ncbi:MAG: UdgX family uracil-DNA binding protein [Variovorax sp.]
MLRTVLLSNETDWPGFRQRARELLIEGVAPPEITWHTPADAAGDLFAASSHAGDTAAQPASVQPDPPATASADITTRPQPNPTSPLSVSPVFLRLCETVMLHRDPGRFALLYRLLWRLAREADLRHDPLDADRVQAQHMAQAVRRDLHKMKAFVRFRQVVRPDAPEPLHVAWFEPEHHIVEAAAPFFMRRFAQMRWAILTPERCVRWDGERLEFSPGAQRSDAPPPDADEALWLTYYRHIFNPARLKLAMMQKEMPRKYWHNLPEAALISPLAAGAHAASGRMMAALPTEPLRRIARTAPVCSAETTAMIADARDDINPSSSSRTSSIDAMRAISSAPLTALSALKQATDRCRECPIGEHATQSVFGEGPAGAVLMVVGEQPGDQEDLRGRPFVGPAGKLFDQAVAQLGWSRAQLYVTNAVKHFKFELRGKRRIHKTPTQREAAACLHWLESEIEQVRPRAIVALGATAARALLGRQVAVMRERGQWHNSPRGERVLVTLHPSALLRGDPAEHEAAYAQWLRDLSLANEIVGVSSADPLSR